MTGNSGFGIRDFGDAPNSNPEFRISFLVQNQAQIPQSDDWLSEEEKIIASGFRVPKRRNDWLLGRWVAKQAIIARHGKAYPLIAALEIRAAQDGAPVAYYEGTPAPVPISISHSRNLALCAVAPTGIAVGCDLEWVERRETNFAADYFTQEEMLFLRQAPEKAELLETLIWSAKETTLKILRRGLTRDTRSVLIRADFSGPVDSWKSWNGKCLESSRVFHGWWRAAEGFVFTIASDRSCQLPTPGL